MWKSMKGFFHAMQLHTTKFAANHLCIPTNINNSPYSHIEAISNVHSCQHTSIMLLDKQWQARSKAMDANECAK